MRDKLTVKECEDIRRGLALDLSNSAIQYAYTSTSQYVCRSHIVITLNRLGVPDAQVVGSAIFEMRRQRGECMLTIDKVDSLVRELTKHIMRRGHKRGLWFYLRDLGLGVILSDYNTHHNYAALLLHTVVRDGLLTIDEAIELGATPRTVEILNLLSSPLSLELLISSIMESDDQGVMELMILILEHENKWGLDERAWAIVNQLDVPAHQTTVSSYIRALKDKLSFKQIN